jgi:hypothetical protein
MKPNRTGTGRIYTDKDISKRKNKAITICDPTQFWFREARKLIDKHSNVLYPDEQTVTAMLCLFIKYGDACIQTIVRERFALEKRHTTVAQRKEQAMRDLEDSENS